MIGEDMRLPYVRRAVAWLKSIQNSDGGWGESLRSYDDPQFKGLGESTASQTAWAFMGLISAGEVHAPEVERGIKYLLNHAGTGRRLGRGNVHRDGFPARVLSALP